jgi:hypothetical protein
MSFFSTITVSPEDREQYRQCVASLNLPIQQIDELIDIVHSIFSYFVDQAFNVQTDQITLKSLGKSGFNGPLAGATIINHPENRTADAQSDGDEAIPTR